MRVCQEDSTIRQQVLSMAHLDSEDRNHLIVNLTQHLSSQGAPIEFMEAIGFLRDDAVAKKIVDLLD